MRYQQLLPLLVLATGLRSEDDLGHVYHAQHLLGAGMWSRVIQIENTRPASPYPRTVHALVFELDAILWIYLPTDGTQHLSQYRGRLEADKADLGPLLLAIDRGFTHWADAPEPPDELPGGRPPNGCFVESIALLRRELEQGIPAHDAALLSYYVLLATGLRGHTVLLVQTTKGIRVIDPQCPMCVVVIRPRRNESPESVANRLRADVVQAVAVPLTELMPVKTS